MECATISGGSLFVDNLIRVASCRDADKLLSRVKLASEHHQQVHARVWLTLEQNQDAIAIDSHTLGRFGGEQASV